MKVRQPRDLPTRACQAHHEPARKRIGNRHHDDRSRVRCVLDGLNRRNTAVHDEDIDLPTGELGGQFRELLKPSGGMSLFDDGVFTLDIAQISQPLLKGGHPVRAEVRRGCRQITDSPDLPRRLRFSRERRKREADSENDREPDQPHGHLGGGRLPGSLAERRDARLLVDRPRRRRLTELDRRIGATSWSGC